MRKSKKLLSLLLALCMVLSLVPISAQAAEVAIPDVEGAIQGLVYDADTQKSVGSTVTATLYGGNDTATPLATTTTNADGLFILPESGNLASGNYTIVFTSNLYLTETKSVTLTNSGGLLISAIYLIPVGRTGGTVTDATTGDVLSGVTVNVYSSNGELTTSTATKADGTYSIETRQGVYDLEFILDGYLTKKLESVALGFLGAPNNVQMTATGGGTGGGENPGGDDDQGGDTKEEMTWTLIDGVLTISGKGVPIPDYDYRNSPPWASSHDDIRTVIIEDSITRIGTNAFDSCGNLTSVAIPSSVTGIGDYAFNSCSSLTSVIIPNGVTSIGDYAFESCRSLTSVTIPDSVTTIGRATFKRCISLTSITIPNSVISIGYEAFSGCGSLTSVTISDGVTSIGGNAFYSCSRLTSVTIPDSVTSIGSEAFRESGLTSVIISNSVTRIEGWTFGYCGLTTVTIPDGVTSIGGNAFYSCSRLTSVTIPNSVTSIENGAFSGFGLGHSLTDVYYSGSETDWAAIDISFSSTL